MIPFGLPDARSDAITADHPVRALERPEHRMRFLPARIAGLDAFLGAGAHRFAMLRRPGRPVRRRCADELDQLGLRDQTSEWVLRLNALEFLGR